MRSRRPRVTFVCYQLDHAAGMERAFARVAALLVPIYDVDVVVARGRSVAPALRAELDGVAVEFGMRKVWARRASADVIVVVGAWAALVAPELWLHRKRVVVWEHTLLRERLPYYPALRRAMPLLRLLYARAAAVVCVSDAVQGFVREMVPAAHTEVIPNVVDEPASPCRDRRAPEGSGLRLLSTQRMVPVKNVELAVQCLAYLPADTTLVCAGDGPRRSNVADCASAIGAGERVDLPGHVDDVADLLERADVLVHTSTSETFGLSLVEAAQHRVPVVCLAGGALREMVPRYAPGVVVTEATAQAFADGVIAAARAWSDPARFAAAAAERRVRFAGNVVVKSWVDTLERLSGQTVAA